MCDIAIPSVSAAVIEFFALFSRFEYALKQCGYMSNEKIAKPDWHKLAKKKNIVALFEKMQNDDGIAILFSAPPNKQIVRNGVLCFEPYAPSVATVDLCDAVKRVRNNLFHGEKDLANWRKRDEELCRASTIVLKTILRADERLLSAYMAEM
jgi:hypothetical protein